jgi:capsular exopolysaccharide synthesis family protein
MRVEPNSSSVAGDQRSEQTQMANNVNLLASAPQSAAQWQEQRIRSLIGAMRRRWRLIAAVLIVTLGATGAWVLLRPPLYTATAMLRLDVPKKYVDFDNVIGGVNTLDPIAIRTAAQMIRSDAIVGQVVNSLGLADDPEFNRNAAATHAIGDTLKSPARGFGAMAEREQAAVVRQVLRGLSLDADGRSYIIGVSFTDSSPEKAARIANSFAQQFLQNLIDAKTEATVRANDWLKSQLSDARGQIDKAEAAVEEFRGPQSQLQDLERQANARRAFFTTMEQRYMQTTALLNGQYADARIVAAASLPIVPSSPNVPVDFAGGLIAALGVSVLLIAGIEYRDKGCRTPKELEAASGLVCFGILPELDRTDRAACSGDWLSATGAPAFREAARTIGTAVRLAVPTAPKGRVILVASSLPQEGKTMSAVAIARALASSGLKTLLIDADLRRPSVARYLGERSGSDLLSLLQAGADPRTTPELAANLHVISPRGPAENAQALLMSAQMESLIERAKTAFDAIVCDSPPVMVVADAAILATLCDLVIFVVRWGRTPVGTILSGVEQLSRMRRDATYATILGRVDLAGYRRYGDDGYCRFKYPEYFATQTESLRDAAE